MARRSRSFEHEQQLAEIVVQPVQSPVAEPFQERLVGLRDMTPKTDPARSSPSSVRTTRI